MRGFYRTTFIFLCSAIYPAGMLASVPAGYYYQAEGKKQKELKTALHQIISNAQMLFYGSGEGKTWQGFFQTDQLEDGSVFDRYSNEKRFFNAFNGVEGMHIEHSFPKSWWGAYENNAYRDLYHLYPADGLTNTTKGNLPLGEVLLPANFDNQVSKIGKNGFGSVYVGSCFEPADAYKGDFARSYLYMATAYENFSDYWNSPMLQNNTYPVWNSWAIELLLKWHRQDPVSDLELKRQEKIFAIQGNRNPFIDYPDLAEHIWGKDTLNNYRFPEETAPFLITPSRWSSCDAGVVLLHNQKVIPFFIEARNMTTPITLALKQSNSSFTLSDKEISPTQSMTGFTVYLDFKADKPGYINDTILLSSPDFAAPLQVPVNALVATDFMLSGSTNITATSACLNWIDVPGIDHYLLDVYQGNLSAGDLLISKYIEGSGWNKAIEIYNGTGAEVDLSNYSLKKQSNGAGRFESEYTLKGLLKAGEVCLITSVNASDELKDRATFILSQESGVVAFNGNDAVGLYRNGIMIDLVGEKDIPNMWGENCTLLRNAFVTHPSVLFSRTEWVEKPCDYYVGIGQHQAHFDGSSAYILQNKNVGTTSEYSITGLLPHNKYTYRVTAVYNDGTQEKSVNSMQLFTSVLTPPEALEATDVTTESFIANWDEVPDATGYLLDVFTLNGSGPTTEVEEFNEIKDGKPLPSGWQGTASVSYSSEGSSGMSPNSIGLKGNEWLQTKEYLPFVKELAFMYRYPSRGTGSYFILDGLAGDEWLNIDTFVYQNTSKQYPKYSFDKPYKAFRFKYAYKSGSTNLALDDISVTYGSADTVFLLKAYPVNDIAYTVSGLQPLTTYYYQLRSAVGSSYSDPSKVIAVKTTSDVSVSVVDKTRIKAFPDGSAIILEGLAVEDLVTMYNITGTILYQAKSITNRMSIPCSASGIFLIRVSSEGHIANLAVVKK
ncbi:MAG: endonuclease [Bacteroidales bacterium]